MTSGDHPDRDQARECLAAYALGALPADEASELEELLGDWPEGRAELAQLTAAADALAFIDEEATPPIGLEGRIIALARSEQDGDGIVALRRRPVGPWWRRYTPHTLAAAFAIVAVVFGLLTFTDDDPVAGVWLLVEPGTSEFDIDGVGVYIVHPGPDPRAVFFAGLEPAPPGQTYTLWAVLETDARLLVGPFDASHSEDLPGLWVGAQPEAAVAGFGVTLEQTGATPSGSELLFTFRAQ